MYNNHETMVNAQYQQIKTQRHTKSCLCNASKIIQNFTLQDSTQSRPQLGFNQELMLIEYIFLSSEANNLSRTCRHFVRNPEKNGTEFVMINEYAPNMKTTTIWSGGEFNSFKFAHAVCFFTTIRPRYLISINYNFNACHHGRYACDAAAADAKQAVRALQGSSGITIHIACELTDPGNTTKHHLAQIASSVPSRRRALKSYPRYVCLRGECLLFFAYCNHNV